jgi:hypothetical protein
MKLNRYLYFFSLAFVLCSCSNGNKPSGSRNASTTKSSSATNPSVKLESNSSWMFLKSQNPETLSEEELKLAYWGYALSQFKGDLSPARISEYNLQKFYRLLTLRSLNSMPAPDMGFTLGGLGVNKYNQYPSRNTEIVFDSGGLNPLTLAAMQSAPTSNTIQTVNVDGDNLCLSPRDGKIKISGTFIDGVGKASVEYFDCHDLQELLLNGKGFMVVHPSTGHGIPEPLGSFFYDAVSVKRYQNESVLSGYRTYEQEYKLTPDNYILIKLQNSRATYEKLSTNQEIIFRTEYIFDSENHIYTDHGSIATSDLGSASFNALNLSGKEDSYTDPIASLTFTGYLGTSGTITVYPHNYVKATIDIDGNGSDDFGQYYSRNEFLADDLKIKPFVSISDMNYPPVIRGNLELFYSPLTSEDVILSEPEYLDIDTPESSLTKKFIWEVDGALISEITGNILPAQYIQNKSRLEVSFTVSDGNNTTSTEILGSSIFNSLR